MALIENVSWSGIIAAIINPVPLARSILQKMRREEQLEYYRAEKERMMTTIHEVEDILVALGEEIKSDNFEPDFAFKKLQTMERKLNSKHILIENLTKELKEVENKQQWHSIEKGKEISMLELQLEESKYLLAGAESSRDRYIQECEERDDTIAKMQFEINNLTAAVHEHQEVIKINTHLMNQMQCNVLELEAQIKVKHGSIFEHGTGDKTEEESAMKAKDILPVKEKKIENLQNILAQKNEDIKALNIYYEDQLKGKNKEIKALQNQGNYSKGMMAEAGEMIHSLKFELEEKKVELRLKEKQNNEMLKQIYKSNSVLV